MHKPYTSLGQALNTACTSLVQAVWPALYKLCTSIVQALEALCAGATSTVRPLNPASFPNHPVTVEKTNSLGPQKHFKEQPLTVCVRQLGVVLKI